MSTAQTVEVFVRLLEEGTPTARPTQAVPMGNSLYKLLPTPDYDPEDEVWEFLPGSIVRCEMNRSEFTEDTFLAIEKIA